MTNLNDLVYDVDGAVATITFARADAMNTLSNATKDAFVRALTAAGQDDAVRVVVITGRGRSFCVGRDLREHHSELESAGGALPRTVFEPAHSPAALMSGMPKPVIAAVNGVAAGAGAGYAFAADFRVLSRSASFRLAFTGVGLSCDNGTSWTLSRLVGLGKAIELLMLPRRIDADMAYSLGLATQVVEDAEFHSSVAELAGALADGPTLAYGAVKEAVSFGASHTMMQALEHEYVGMNQTRDSQDHRRAVQAFVDGRKASFEGR